MENVSPIRYAAVYSGTNSSDVLAMVQKVTPYSGNVWTIKSEDASGLVLNEAGINGLSADWLIMPDTYIAVDPAFGIVARVTPSAGAARYRSFKTIFMEAVTDPDVLAGLRATLKPQLACGSVAIPALLLGASTSLTVALDGVFPDTNYSVSVRAINGTSVLSMLQVVSVVKNVGSVVVTVKANGLASLAGVLLVDCFRTN